MPGQSGLSERTQNNRQKIGQGVSDNRFVSFRIGRSVRSRALQELGRDRDPIERRFAYEIVYIIVNNGNLNRLCHKLWFIALLADLGHNFFFGGEEFVSTTTVQRHDSIN